MTYILVFGIALCMLYAGIHFLFNDEQPRESAVVATLYGLAIATFVGFCMRYL